MSGVVRSMTGYACGDGLLPSGASFLLSVKGVNHRFLDLQFRLPPGCDALEAQLRKVVREQVQRGHLTISVEVRREEVGPASVQVNEPLLEGLVKVWRQTSERLGLSSEPDLGALLRVPGVLVSERAVGAAAPAPEQWWVVVEPIAGEVLRAFDEVRRCEGEELVQALREGVARMKAATATIRRLREDVRTTLVARLQVRLAELSAGQGLSEERLLQEAALLAEKSDVEEEVVRAQSHAKRFLQLLDAGGPVGKQLDFLLQELQREANTMLSKTGAAAGQQSLLLTEAGLSLKTGIERAREQVQNLE